MAVSNECFSVSVIGAALITPSLGLCPKCRKPWHPPQLCWAYQWLDVKTIERIEADIYNLPFDQMMLEHQVRVWEGEGGR